MRSHTCSTINRVTSTEETNDPSSIESRVSSLEKTGVKGLGCWGGGGGDWCFVVGGF